MPYKLLSHADEQGASRPRGAERASLIDFGERKDAVAVVVKAIEELVALFSRGHVPKMLNTGGA